MAGVRCAKCETINFTKHFWWKKLGSKYFFSVKCISCGRKSTKHRETLEFFRGDGFCASLLFMLVTWPEAQLSGHMISDHSREWGLIGKILYSCLCCQNTCCSVQIYLCAFHCWKMDNDEQTLNGRLGWHCWDLVGWANKLTCQSNIKSLTLLAEMFGQIDMENLDTRHKGVRIVEGGSRKRMERSQSRWVWAPKNWLSLDLDVARCRYKQVNKRFIWKSWIPFYKLWKNTFHTKL